jgi:hypothetical protein
LKNPFYFWLHENPFTLSIPEKNEQVSSRLLFLKINVLAELNRYGIVLALILTMAFFLPEQIFERRLQGKERKQEAFHSHVTVKKTLGGTHEKTIHCALSSHRPGRFDVLGSQRGCFFRILHFKLPELSRDHCYLQRMPRTRDAFKQRKE